MPAVVSIRDVSLSVLLAAVAIACGDATPAGPNGGTDPFKDRVQVASPDTTGSTSGPSQGDGFFRGSVMGYSLADLPDTLKSAKPLANVAVAAYPAELTDKEPKLGPLAAKV